MEGIIKAWAEELESESAGASAVAEDGESKEAFVARQATTASTLASARLDCCRTVHKIAQNIQDVDNLWDRLHYHVDHLHELIGDEDE